MKTSRDIQKDTMRELAWKELIEAIHPHNKVLKSYEDAEGSRLPAKTSGKAVVHHPAILTNPDLSKWEIFG